MADPGGIWISRNVYEQIKGKNEYEYQYTGEQKAKNVRDPIRTYRVLLGQKAPATSFELTDERGELELPERPSIVVPPFSSLGGDPDADQIAEGLWIDIQNALTRVSGVFLIATASAKACRGKSASSWAAGACFSATVRRGV